MRPAGRRLDDAFLAEIARQYNAHVAAEWPPIRAIAVANRITTRTAAHWIRICRARGFVIEPGDVLQHHYPEREAER